MNTKRTIESIERQNEFLAKEISKIESQLADHIWKADSYGMQPYGAGPTRKATLLERKIAQLKSHLEKNNVRISKLKEIGQPVTRGKFGFIRGDPDLMERYEREHPEQNLTDEECQRLASEGIAPIDFFKHFNRVIAARRQQ